MKIIPYNINKNIELPIKLTVSFVAIFEYLEKIALDKNNYLQNTAINLLETYKQFPELRNGFSNLRSLEKYNKEIDTLLSFLFPDLLQTNEIKAATIPFYFTTFKLSKRFEEII